MKLAELCEPIFQYMCRLNRSARRGLDLDANVVRADVEQILGDAKQKANADPLLSDNFARVELPLIYFIDFMVKESKLSFAREWRELAHERDKLAGDEEFFDLLDETLADTSESATDRLEVFYTCLGLGFAGFYSGQTEPLRKKTMEVASRLRRRMETEQSARLVPEAYEHVDTSDLIQPPARGLIGVAVAVLASLVVVLIVNAVLYGTSSGKLRAALETITEQAEVADGG
jgi:type VI secretion system protein ImpK